jgi:tight adherence protein B
MTKLHLMQIVGSTLLAFGGVFSVYLLVSAASGPVARMFGAYHAQLEWDLRFLKSDVNGKQAIWAQALTCVGLIAATVVRDQWLYLSLVPPVLFLPQGLIANKRLLRVVTLDAQVDTWLVILANALRATPALGEAMASSARLVSSPLSDELELVLREYQLGAPLDVALRTMVVRLKSRTVNVALGTLRIARTTGGNLPDTLETSAAALREMARLDGVVRTKTAEGKAQATVVAVMPFPLVGMLNYLNPKLLAPLWNTLEGYGLLFGAFVLWLMAVLWARKILDVDI